MDTVEAKTAMLIRRPVNAVFAAFVDPAITTRFWFSSSSGALQPGATVRWEWAMFGAAADVRVMLFEPPRRLVIEWPGKGRENSVEWVFTRHDDDATLVAIRETGFDPAASDVIAQVADATGGFSLVLAGAKAYLEHNIELNLVADRFPDGHHCAG